jgi:hypothetical protein
MPLSDAEKNPASTPTNPIQIPEETDTADQTPPRKQPPPSERNPPSASSHGVSASPASLKADQEIDSSLDPDILREVVERWGEFGSRRKKPA